MVKTLREANFKCSKADLNVWFQAAMKADRFKYYEYVLVYIDDILAVYGNPKVIMDYLESKYMLKNWTHILAPRSLNGTSMGLKMK